MAFRQRSLPTKVAAALAVAVLMFASVPADAQRAPSTKRAAKNEAPAPEDDQGMAAAPQAAITRGNVPVNAELTALTPPYKSFANVEYQPKNAPPEGALVKDIMGLNTQTATDCAKKCTATKGCNAVTWVGANTAYIGPSNCWLKTISVPCVLPVYAEAYPDTFLLMQQTPGCKNVTGLPPNTGPPASQLGPMAAAGPAMAPDATVATAGAGNVIPGGGADAPTAAALSPADSTTSPGAPTESTIATPALSPGATETEASTTRSVNGTTAPKASPSSAVGVASGVVAAFAGVAALAL